MSKIEEVRADMVKAMKAGDKETKETLSILVEIGRASCRERV